MIKSEDRNGLSMRKSTKLSAKLVFEDLYSEVRNGHNVRRVCHIIMSSIFIAGFGIYRFNWKATCQKLSLMNVRDED